MKKNTRQTHPKSSTTIANIPDGYTIGTGPDGQQYLVPQFMVPDLDQAFASYRSKTVLDVSNSPAGCSQSQERGFVELGEVLLAFPPDPELSQQEHFNLHAEVVALQERLGTSYKDASHRLYLAEAEKLKVADEKHKAFKNLDERIGNYLKRLNTRFGDERKRDEGVPDADADADADADID